MVQNCLIGYILVTFLVTTTFGAETCGGLFSLKANTEFSFEQLYRVLPQQTLAMSSQESVDFKNINKIWIKLPEQKPKRLYVSLNIGISKLTPILQSGFLFEDLVTVFYRSPEGAFRNTVSLNSNDEFYLNIIVEVSRIECQSCFSDILDSTMNRFRLIKPITFFDIKNIYVLSRGTVRKVFEPIDLSRLN